MDVLGYARLLRSKNMDSEVWLDGVPSDCVSFVQHLQAKFPDQSDQIEDLLPGLSAKGHHAISISAVSTDPASITQAVINAPREWRGFLEDLPTATSDCERARLVHDEIIARNARQLHPLWVLSHRRHGWMSAQIEGGGNLDARAMVTRGLQLSRLAPNIMIKVPGSEEGYKAIESLVAQGCSINNTFCFTVSQVSACLKAINLGRLRAQVQGVNTERAVHVISFMIGSLSAEPIFEHQAQDRLIRMTAADRRWAEILVYQAIQSLLLRRPTPVRLVLCNLSLDIDTQGEAHCWHLQRTGAETTIYALTPQMLEFLLTREQQNQPITPANGWVQAPKRTLNRLLMIEYFNQAYFEGDLAPAEFAQHPAFVKASQQALEAEEQLQAFVRGLRDNVRVGARSSTIPCMAGHMT